MESLKDLFLIFPLLWTKLPTAFQEETKWYSCVQLDILQCFDKECVDVSAAKTRDKNQTSHIWQNEYNRVSSWSNCTAYFLAITGLLIMSARVGALLGAETPPPTLSLRVPSLSTLKSRGPSAFVSVVTLRIRILSRPMTLLQLPSSLLTAWLLRVLEKSLPSTFHMFFYEQNAEIKWASPYQ